MDTLNFTANITYVEHVVIDDSEFLSVTAMVEDADKNKLQIHFNNANGMLKAFLAGDPLVGTRIAGYGRIDLTSVANAYESAKTGDISFYKQPRMHLRYVYVERQDHRTAPARQLEAAVA